MRGVRSCCGHSSPNDSLIIMSYTGIHARGLGKTHCLTGRRWRYAHGDTANGTRTMYRDVSHHYDTKDVNICFLMHVLAPIPVDVERLRLALSQVAAQLCGRLGPVGAPDWPSVLVALPALLTSFPSPVLLSTSAHISCQHCPQVSPLPCSSAPPLTSPASTAHKSRLSRAPLQLCSHLLPALLTSLASPVLLCTSAHISCQHCSQVSPLPGSSAPPLTSLASTAHKFPLSRAPLHLCSHLLPALLTSLASPVLLCTSAHISCRQCPQV
jgi:hypothetical protein